MARMSCPRNAWKVLASILGLCALGSVAEAKTAYEAVPGQYVVQLKPAVAAASAQRSFAAALSASLGATPIERVRADMILVQRPVGERSDAAIKSMAASPIVKLVEPNYIYRTSRTPNDEKYEKLWGMNNVGQKDPSGKVGTAGVDIEAEKAWDIETGSKKTVVAVIDTGVDFTIPDLKDNAWTNLAELNGLAGVDDDSNGYVDDVHGYDFANDKGDVVDDNGHGSHCAGTIGAKGDDGQGVAGVSWDVSIMTVKFIDKDGSGSLSAAIKAIDYARKNGAQIMSNSWGGGAPSDLLKTAIEDARTAGSLFVVAAGNGEHFGNGVNNDQEPTYPANYPVDNVLSVAAVDNTGYLARFSNYGARTVHVAAPGVNILSTFPSAISSAGFKSLSGTSMATPHVAGVAALVLSHEPTMTYKELKDRLVRSARPMAQLKGKVASGGMIDAYLALTGQMAPLDPNDPANWTMKQAFAASTPHPYPSKYEQEVKATVPGAAKVAAHFAKFATEARYDWVEFFDGAGKSLGRTSGKLGEMFSPVADGDTIVIKFKSDDTSNDYGFDVDSISYKQ